MAKKTYIGVNNVAREVKKMYIGVNGIAKKVTKAYIGDENGRARLVYSSEQSYNITYFGATDSQVGDILYTAKAGDTVYGDIGWDSSAYGPAYIIVASAHNPLVYYRADVEDYGGQGVFSFIMPPDDIKVYIFIDDGNDYGTVIGEYYSVSNYTYDRTNISVTSYPALNEYVEAGTSTSMSFYCTYTGNVTAILKDAETGQVLETKVFKNVGNGYPYTTYSFLMPFADVTIELAYEGVNLMRPIRYVDIGSYNDVDISYLPGIPTSAQIGSTVDLTPWFENSPNGYVAECIDWQDEIGAGNWVVGDGYGDLTFEMPSMGIIVMTSGVPDGSEEEESFVIYWIDNHPAFKFTHLLTDNKSYTTSGVYPYETVSASVEMLDNPILAPRVIVTGQSSGTIYFDDNIGDTNNFSFTMPYENVTVTLEEV